MALETVLTIKHANDEVSHFFASGWNWTMDNRFLLVENRNHSERIFFPYTSLGFIKIEENVHVSPLSEVEE